ncbi:hypothetical protein TRFO_31697 [Tritrichomonas foetus]|uniref:Transmembrane protein n=1 Tax=Tritrichomonas foetus TaxID=1144522 RepID=A0A1J4JVB7_9EUKA|nr:hypothetical protein TRFO_31697 [Tritrichomonas foetus]|eukprot:OHT01470.1 hypothetical protein TRFO_31697 [Tritrichomonas foetus]
MKVQRYDQAVKRETRRLDQIRSKDEARQLEEARKREFERQKIAERKRLAAEQRKAQKIAKKRKKDEICQVNEEQKQLEERINKEEQRKSNANRQEEKYKGKGKIIELEKGIIKEDHKGNGEKEIGENLNNHYQMKIFTYHDSNEINVIPDLQELFVSLILISVFVCAAFFLALRYTQIYYLCCGFVIIFFVRSLDNIISHQKNIIQSQHILKNNKNFKIFYLHNLYIRFIQNEAANERKNIVLCFTQFVLIFLNLLTNVSTKIFILLEISIFFIYFYSDFIINKINYMKEMLNKSNLILRTCKTQATESYSSYELIYETTYPKNIRDQFNSFFTEVSKMISFRRNNVLSTQFQDDTIATIVQFNKSLESTQFHTFLVKFLLKEGYKLFTPNPKLRYIYICESLITDENVENIIKYAESLKGFKEKHRNVIFQNSIVTALGFYLNYKNSILAEQEYIFSVYNFQTRNENNIYIHEELQFDNECILEYLITKLNNVKNFTRNCLLYEDKKNVNKEIHLHSIQKVSVIEFDSYRQKLEALLTLNHLLFERKKAYFQPKTDLFYFPINIHNLPNNILKILEGITADDYQFEVFNAENVTPMTFIGFNTLLKRDHILSMLRKAFQSCIK